MREQSPTRVLIVDDSPSIRKVLRTAINHDPELELIGEADSGQRITEMVHKLQPDVVLLDVEMPLVGGLEALSAIHSAWPGLPVVMFSTRTGSGSSATIEALARGATDYVEKPRAGSASDAILATTEHVLPKLKRAHRRAVPLKAPTQAAALGSRLAPNHVDVVVIGTSTGGPQALSTVLGSMPANLPVPILVVQHMPASFTAMFAERLDRLCAISVTEARNGQVPEPGVAYIAPGDVHLAVDTHRRLVLQDSPPENSCKPAADVLFRTAAGAYRSRILAVLMTGMGTDGTEGARDIVAAGGALLCQDQETSVVWGMPGTAARAGLCYQQLPLNDIASEIVRVVRGRS